MNIFPCEGDHTGNNGAQRSIRVSKKQYGGKRAKRFYERFEKELIIKKQTSERNKRSLKKIKQDLAKEKQMKEFSKIQELIEKANYLQIPQCKQQLLKTKEPSKSGYSDLSNQLSSNKLLPFYRRSGKLKNKISLSKEKRQSHSKQQSINQEKNISPPEKIDPTQSNDVLPLTVQSILSEEIYEQECSKNYMMKAWNNSTEPQSPFLSKNISDQAESMPQNNYLEKYSLRLTKK